MPHQLIIEAKALSSTSFIYFYTETANTNSISVKFNVGQLLNREAASSQVFVEG